MSGYKLFNYILVSGIVFFSSACVRQSEFNKLSQKKDSLETVSNHRAEQLEMITSYIDTIASSIDSLTHQEVLLLSETGADGVKLSKKEIRANLELLESLIDRQRSKIYELDSALVVMTDSTNRLRSVISFLYRQLEEKDLEIQRMKAEIGLQNKKIKVLSSKVTSLQSDVTELTTKSREQTEAILAQNSTIAQQDSLIYTAYYIVDTKKGLKDKGILSGNVFRGNKIDVNADMTDYTMIDIRKSSSIEISGSKVKVLSPMPSGTYYIENISPKKHRLVISDVTAFWSVSKILIIQI